MKEIAVAATVGNIRVVTDFINENLDIFGCSVKAQMQIDIAIDEILSNIIRYAYGNETGNITVGIREKNGTAEIIFKDSGIPYDPLTAKEPDLSLSSEDRPIGGLGIHMVKKMMDTVSYRYENGQNTLILQKQIKKG